MTEPLFAGSGATFSPCRSWRYHLWREWGDPANRVCFLMANPSTADEVEPDHTITKCIGFAQRWSYGRLDVVNLFAWQSTEIRNLLNPHDPIGPDNDATILRVCASAKRVVIAWGTHAPVRRLIDARGAAVRRLLADCKTPVGHLGVCKDGEPRHPLMLAYSTPFEPTFWTKCAEVRS